MLKLDYFELLILNSSHEPSICRQIRWFRLLFNTFGCFPRWKLLEVIEIFTAWLRVTWARISQERFLCVCLNFLLFRTHLREKVKTLGSFGPFFANFVQKNRIFFSHHFGIYLLGKFLFKIILQISSTYYLVLDVFMTFIRIAVTWFTEMNPFISVITATK